MPWITLSLLFGGGFTLWYGWVAAQRIALGIGAVALGLAFGKFVWQGQVAPILLWLLPLGAGLVLALKRYHHPLWQSLGWVLYSALVLALGFHLFPHMSPVVLWEEAGSPGSPLTFAPESLLLMGLLPTMVLSLDHPPRFAHRPWRATGMMGVVTLAIVIPLALALEVIRPAFTQASVGSLLYRLAHNLLFVCWLEESFFRGILQTALIKGFSQLGWISAGPLGILVTALLFGVAHWQGGGVFMLVATVAGIGYGTTYYVTGRVHHAAWVHFAVNGIHYLVFADG